MNWLTRKLKTFSEWMAWSAWNYARKRAIRRTRWVPGEAEKARNDQTPQHRVSLANEARQMLENRHFLDAWNALNASLESQALGCAIDTAAGIEKAARITVAKQLLHGLKREFERKLSDGYMAEVELDEINLRKRPVRMVR